MNYSSHYNLNLVEGTDLVNPLTVDVPNYTAIDTQMYANEQAGVGTATELKSGTIHAITRANTNQNTFKFRATSNFVSGDTFTVDGNVVTALNVNGSSLAGGCFIIGSEVLCTLYNTQLTIIGSYVPIASDVPFDDTNVSYTANNVQSAIEYASTASGTEYSTGVSVKDKLDTIVTSYADSGITASKIGNLCTVSLWFDGMTLGGDGKTFVETIRAGFRPSRSFSIVTQAYNGSDWVNALVNIGYDGIVSITGTWNESITGLQKGYTRGGYYTYLIS